MSDDVVICPHAGGIGDQLLHAVLLKLFTKRGRRVLVSSQVLRPPMVRNDEIAKLVWETNPYFIGYSDAPPNAGLAGRVEEYGKLVRKLGHPAIAMAMLHGFAWTPTPQALYYRPKFRPELENVILADPTSSSQAVPAPVFEDFAQYVGRDLGFGLKDVVLLKPQHTGIHGRDTLAGNQVFPVADIFEWVDAIASCGAFLTTEAGGQSVGAAVRLRNTYSVHSCKAFSEKLFIWPNVTYCPSGRLGADFHSGVYAC